MDSRSFQRLLERFLDSFASRRSEYGGFWLFGFLVDGGLDLEIDLRVAAPLVDDRPIDVAKRRAEGLYFAALAAAQFHPQDVTTAVLKVRTEGDPVDEAVGGAVRRGRRMRFTINCVFRGAPFCAELTRFVAPHDPGLEHTSDPSFDEGEGRDT